jgi:DNA ligase (NAD+)
MVDKSKLVEQLNTLTDLYDQGNPAVSDEEWDDLYFQLLDANQEADEEIEDDPTQSVHYAFVTQLKKIEHNHPMLSLGKTKDINEVEKFIHRQPYLAMAKMDGLTCSLRYLDGKLVSAETRGNGKIGEDVLHNAMVIPSIPKEIDYKDELIVDGEIICKISDFEDFADQYRNPRNFASGSIRLLDAAECAKRKLTFIAWDVIKGFDDKKLLSEKLDPLLINLGFEVVPFVISNYFEDFNEDLEFIQQSCKTLGYPIDGVVFKFDNIEYGAAQGETSHHFKNAIAYKFYDDKFLSVLRDIEWTMGRTGALTPVGIFDPIEIEGTIVSKASLHNLRILQETLTVPYVGQHILVFKANMIIPQIASGDPPLDDTDYDYLSIPNVCPYCGKPLERENDFLYCTNPTCEAKLINRLNHFCGKKGLDIKGLSKATLEKLLDWGWVENYSDIFNLKAHRAEWITKSGFGEKSVDNILSAIESARNCSLVTFIASLGIPLIGNTVAKELVKHISSYEELQNKVKSHFDFSEYDGFASSKTLALWNYDFSEADKLYFILNIINDVTEPTDNSLEGKTIVITGKLTRYKNRAALQADIEAHGGRVVSSVTKSTDLLINNDTTSQSAKNLSAQKLGIKIINEEDFCNMYLTF